MTVIIFQDYTKNFAHHFRESFPTGTKPAALVW